MRHLALFSVVMSVLAGCGSGARDQAAAKAVRSLTAERTLVSELDRRGQLRRAYADGMRREAQTQIEANEKQREAD